MTPSITFFKAKTVRTKTAPLIYSQTAASAIVTT